MGEWSEKYEWWQVAPLEEDLGPLDVYTRLEKATENLIEALTRARVLFRLTLLEGVEIEQAVELAGCAEHGFGSRLDEFRLEMRRSALFVAEGAEGRS